VGKQVIKYYAIKIFFIHSFLHKLGAFCLPIIQIVWETIKDIQSGKAPTASGNNSAATGDFL
jgi:hypothetical protein